MGNVPGRVVVAVSNPTKRTLIDDEAVAYHEGVPGHHMQISIAQTLEGSTEVSAARFLLRLWRRLGALFRGARQRDRFL